MPAGDLLSGNWQIELNGVLFGVGTGYDLFREGGGIRGLGVPPVKSSDTEYAHADGGFAAEDFVGMRTITGAFQYFGDDDADAMSALSVASVPWSPSTVDVEMHLQLPGWGHVYVTGRPRGLAEDLDDIDEGILRFVGTFLCPDPTIYTP